MTAQPRALRGEAEKMMDASEIDWVGRSDEYSKAWFIRARLGEQRVTKMISYFEWHASRYPEHLFASLTEEMQDALLAHAEGFTPRAWQP